jgi:hypothetical protein
VPQLLPQGQQVAGQWSLLTANNIVGGNPQFPAGWNLLPILKPDGTVRGYNLQK